MQLNIGDENNKDTESEIFSYSFTRRIDRNSKVVRKRDDFKSERAQGIILFDCAIDLTHQFNNRID